MGDRMAVEHAAARRGTLWLWTDPTTEERTMAKSTVVPIAAIAVVVAAAALLNPSAERHRDKIKEATGNRNQVARVLGLGSLKAFASSYHSLGIASYTTAGEKTLSFGAFGLVFVTN
jgi:heme O synthase-like polyprenyltransferase